jgi:hypothetical protein
MRAVKDDSTSWYLMREPFEIIAINWDFAPEEFRKMEQGRLPIGTGDRYFIFLEEDCLYINYLSGSRFICYGSKK